jgi:hypothetical protein
LHQCHHFSCLTHNSCVWACNLYQLSSWIDAEISVSLSVPLPPFLFSLPDNQMDFSVERNDITNNHQTEIYIVLLCPVQK